MHATLYSALVRPLNHDTHVEWCCENSSKQWGFVRTGKFREFTIFYFGILDDLVSFCIMWDEDILLKGDDVWSK